MCHGHPSEDDILCNGDIINVDCSTIYKGYYSDSSRMFIIGETTPEKKKLVEVTRECVMAGLEQVKPWGFLGDMGQAVHDLAKKNGYSVVRDVGGHGVGIQFHEEPWVSYVTRRGQEMVMAPGMMFTIEPMINMGTDDIYVDADNDWTIYTEDGMPSAQWEIQVLVTETGPRSHLVVKKGTFGTLSQTPVRNLRFLNLPLNKKISSIRCLLKLRIRRKKRLDKLLT